MKLLLVDKDRDLVEMLMNWLKTLGFEVYRAYTGKQACLQWEQQEPDLVMIDPALQEMDGLTVCQQMRSTHDALMLVMTEGADAYTEVNCLESGADDYVHKPFSPAQLLAHIHAVSRRGRSTLALRPSSIVAVEPLRIDTLRNEVTVEDKTVRLTPTEGKLLHLLATNAHQVCTAQHIVEHLWGFGDDGDTCLIKTHIRHLRLKIEPDPSHPIYLLTVPGVGYTLTCHGKGEEHISSKELVSALRVAAP